MRGARLIRIYTIDDPDPRRNGGFREAAVLAWARLGSGDWGALTAWLGGWQQNGRTTGKGRWAWCRVLLDRTQPMPIPRRYDEEAEWHGHYEADLDEFTAAMHQAAASLPPHLREAALAPSLSPIPDSLRTWLRSPTSPPT